MPSTSCWLMPSAALFSWLMGCSLTQAQTLSSDTTYYVLPAYRIEKSAAPGRSRFDSPVYELASRELSCWYVGPTGFYRQDQNRQSGELTSLVTVNSVGAWGIGGVAGYMNRRWAFEGGYTWSPIHTELSIANRPQPFVFRYQNNGQTVVGRVKRRIGNASNPPGSGFWVTAGGWLVVNPKSYEQTFVLQGISYSRPRASADTIRLTNATRTSNPISGLVELGIGYSTRVHKRVILDMYLRRYWGIGQALQSTLIYQSTNSATQTGHVTANGEGWGIGIGIYYRYTTRYSVASR